MSIILPKDLVASFSYLKKIHVIQYGRLGGGGKSADGQLVVKGLVCSAVRRYKGDAVKVKGFEPVLPVIFLNEPAFNRQAAL